MKKRQINEIQKGILAISQKEEPFDVFICYKETDSQGRRSPDSVLANDLYHQLIAEGYKVFFSRITLEDKLGTAYEPYIFAALNSAKVMVVLGTKPEYFNAVWVKNEWSRYLSLIKNGADKILIPAYRDMDPYDLPEEFSHLQAQDMSKLGFMQDLIRGIKKLTKTDEPKQSVVVKETVVTSSAPSIATNTESLLKRVFMFLEDGDWESADEYCEKVLDIEPECANAYLGKLMAEKRVKTKESLKDCQKPFDDYNNYKKVLRFGDEALKSELIGYVEYIKDSNEKERLEGIYTGANQLFAKAFLAKARSESEFLEAAKLFDSIPNYKDSKSLADKCRLSAESARKDKILEEGKDQMASEFVWNYEDAIKLFETIPGWKDADKQIEKCKAAIEEIEREEEAELKEAQLRTQKLIVTASLCGFALLILIFLTVELIVPTIQYNEAVDLAESGKLDEAYDAFIVLDGFKDSADRAGKIRLPQNIEKIKEAKIGDYVKFGVYEQDNDTFNGKEEIEWLVLDVKDSKVLVISKYALDSMPYNSTNEDVTWENCTLRDWLNSEFINTAFAADELAMIPTVTVSADKNPLYNTNPGNATQDKVFLLSISEVYEYLTFGSARACMATDYADEKGAHTSGNGYCWWWLRSPGSEQNEASYVEFGWYIREDGDSVGDRGDAVRPAMWIELN